MPFGFFLSFFQYNGEIKSSLMHTPCKVLSVCLSVVFGEEYLAHNASPLSRFSQRERERDAQEW